MVPKIPNSVFSVNIIHGSPGCLLRVIINPDIVKENGPLLRRVCIIAHPDIVKEDRTLLYTCAY